MSAPDAPGRRVVVVGGGIAGLAAAWELRGLLSERDELVLLESGDRLGGKMLTADVAGVPVDQGAESFLLRVPDALGMVRESGFGDEVVHPASGATMLALDGRLRPLPARTLMGVPADLDAAAADGVLDEASIARARRDLSDPGEPVTEDVSVGAYVSRRLGRAVVDRLVDPLLGGVYAGRADGLSLRATVPTLAAAAARHTSVIAAAQEALAPPAVPTAPATPVFATVRSGLGTWAGAIGAGLGPVVRTDVTVREIHRTPTGFRLVTGPVPAPVALDADAVVVAVPATPAARLLAEVCPVAARELSGLDYSSVAIITLAYPPGTAVAGLTGVLVPASSGRAVKALTMVDHKWTHLDGGPMLMRASAGRIGDTAVLDRTDDELADLVAGDVAALVDVPGRPIASRVQRWGGALPQYAPGHLDRMARLGMALASVAGLEVAGAAYAGVGVPACVRTGRSAARAVARHLGIAGAESPVEAGATDRGGH